MFVPIQFVNILSTDSQRKMSITHKTFGIFWKPFAYTLILTRSRLRDCKLTVIVGRGYAELQILKKSENGHSLVVHFGVSWWFYSFQHYDNLKNGPGHAKTCLMSYANNKGADQQSDQHLYCSLLRKYDMYTCYIQRLRILASYCSWAGWFESYLVKNLRRHIFAWCGSNGRDSRSLCWLSVCVSARSPYIKVNVHRI